MLTPTQVEAIVAVIGIDKILAATPTFNQEQRQKAQNLAKWTRAQILKFFSKSEPTESEELPDFDYETVSKQLQTVGEPQAHALYDVLKGFLHDDDAQAVVNAATRIIVTLQKSIPRRVYRSVVNETVMAPEPYSLGRWQRQWNVATDPLLVVKDLVAGIIDPGMVSTLQQTYSNLYQMILTQLDDAIATMKTRRGDAFDIPEAKNRDLKILLQVPYLNFDLVNAYAAAPDPTAAQNQAAPRARPLSDNSPDDAAAPEELPGQASPNTKA